ATGDNSGDVRAVPPSVVLRCVFDRSNTADSAGEVGMARVDSAVYDPDDLSFATPHSIACQRFDSDQLASPLAHSSGGSYGQSLRTSARSATATSSGTLIGPSKRIFRFDASVTFMPSVASIRSLIF